MSDDRVAELRAATQSRLRKENLGFPAADMARLRNDGYLMRFLRQHDNDVQMALDLLWNTLVWRKSVGASALDETNINLDYIREGIVFPHGRDVDGCLILIFKCKKLIRGQKDFLELKKCIIYWFDRVERQENGAPITLFFDMANCGISNVDMEYTKCLMSMVKLYYPQMLNYIIVFEVPWVLSTAFKVVKTLLPPTSGSRIKSVNRSNLKKYVRPEQALASCGGTSKYEFVFTPENATRAAP